MKVYVKGANDREFRFVCEVECENHMLAFEINKLAPVYGPGMYLVGTALATFRLFNVTYGFRVENA